MSAQQYASGVARVIVSGGGGANSSAEGASHPKGVWNDNSK